jgi:hypothetical protein
MRRLRREDDYGRRIEERGRNSWRDAAVRSRRNLELQHPYSFQSFWIVDRHSDRLRLQILRVGYSSASTFRVSTLGWVKPLAFRRGWINDVQHIELGAGVVFRF